MSKISSRAFRNAIGCLLALALSACAATPRTPPAPSPRTSAPPESAAVREDSSPPTQDQSPRALASLRLTEQARALLENGKVDDAMRTLERAINLSPSDGRNYYYLAEAWLKKRNFSQAREFNRLAAVHLRNAPSWMSRVKAQEDRIRMR